jgi:hypothetical protein
VPLEPGDVAQQPRAEEFAVITLAEGNLRTRQFHLPASLFVNHISVLFSFPRKVIALMRCSIKESLADARRQLLFSAPPIPPDHSLLIAGESGEAKGELNARIYDCVHTTVA